MSKTTKRILIVVGVGAVIFAALKMFGGNKNDSEKVAVEKVVRRTIIETVTANGQIYPEVEVKISPDISGEVTELKVAEGDSVRKGQVLARIFADIYALQRDQAASQVNQSQATVANSEAALEALNANLRQAQQAYDRNKALYDEKVISKAELEQFETTLRSAQANYNAAKQNIASLKATVQSAQTGLTRANKDLGRTTLVAPMDGVISSLLIKQGERVAGNSFNVGTEMMTVADMSVLEVRVDVGENDIVRVNIGDSADIEVDAYNNRKFKGVVTQIASSTKATAASAVSNEVTNYEVRIRLDPASYSDLVDPSKPRRWPFRPGMNASADIKTRRVENVLAVPSIAVTSRVKGSDESLADKKKEQNEQNDEKGSQEESTVSSSELEEVVFVVQKDGTVKKVLVKSGIQDITYIEIVSGLTGNEDVVVSPYAAISKTLKDGAKVTVVPKEKLFEKK
ncbi:MAG: efflux RND transporter periplasmic adaptor subunit [Sphingobacteriales bacterium]|jgi:HlyD family secretion protein|nr:efflux RND transporter periplasmic adaptor subunit [Sphingobacteriales bacterium]NCT75500.1 HlyD family efflux transporter periplasmic adaptor subunit [Chitinophagaceae bacterium]OJW30627.1 MAG: efflux transporter periplasmic adaptor subunit [Sphingobacteriales bacterium 46-32]